MAKDTRTPEQVQADNLDHFMERGPGLSYGYGHFVVARDRAKKRVLLGGLGSMGVGQMWFDEDPAYTEYPGWYEAPEADSEPDGTWRENLAAELRLMAERNEP